MKVREIGEKIGDIELSAPSMPSKTTQAKVAVFIGMVYRLVFWGWILFGCWIAGYNFVDLQDPSPYADPDNTKLRIGGGFAVIAATIVGNLFIKWFIKTFKQKVAEL